MHEYIRTNHAYTGRRIGCQLLGEREKISSAFSPAGANHPDGIAGCFQSRHSQALGYLPSDRPVMAGAFFGSAISGVGKRRPASGTFPKDQSPESYSYSECYPAYNAFQCNSLECAHYGQIAENQRSNCLAHLETIQSETPFDQNVQAQPGQAVPGETLRYCWSLYESAGQIDCLLCGRKKPDSGIRADTALASAEARYSCKTNSRLYAPWYNDIICSIKHARRHCAGRLYATAQTSGIYQIPADYQYKDSSGSGPSPDSRQLRHTQTSTCSEVVKTPSQVSHAFYAHIQFVGKPGRTMVLRDNIKKNSSWLVQKCKRANHSYQTIH